MAKYLLLKHYRGAPAPINDVPMDQWSPEEISTHVQYMQDFADRLERTGAASCWPVGFGLSVARRRRCSDSRRACGVGFHSPWPTHRVGHEHGWALISSAQPVLQQIELWPTVAEVATGWRVGLACRCIAQPRLTCCSSVPTVRVYCTSMRAAINRQQAGN